MNIPPEVGDASETKKYHTLVEYDQTEYGGPFKYKGGFAAVLNYHGVNKDKATDEYIHYFSTSSAFNIVKKDTTKPDADYEKVSDVSMMKTEIWNNASDKSSVRASKSDNDVGSRPDPKPYSGGPSPEYGQAAKGIISISLDQLGKAAKEGGEQIIDKITLAMDVLEVLQALVPDHESTSEPGPRPAQKLKWDYNPMGGAKDVINVTTFRVVNDIGYSNIDVDVKFQGTSMGDSILNPGREWNVTRDATNYI